MNTDPRHIALNILVQSCKKRMTLDQSIDNHASGLAGLSHRDRKLANAIVHGTLRYRGHLDWIIQSFSTRDLDKVNISALNLIRMALFQIIYMDRIPVSAAVNTSVTIAKKVTDKKTAGFVNAVLRNASVKYLEIVFPDPNKEPVKYLSAKKSISLFIAQKWLKQYGFNVTSELCDTIKIIPDISIRTNTLKISRDELLQSLKDHCKQVRLTSISNLGLLISTPYAPIQDMAPFKKGFFQVQDEAAQLVTDFLEPQPGESVLDACAGLGGKTGHMAQLMKNNGKITAVDTDGKKLKELGQVMNRLGVDIVSTKQVDILHATVKDFKGQFFDRVLLDAPCTGLGVLRRNPDAIWKRSIQDIQRLAAQQKKLLNTAANLVKPGGRLVYAVCSCEPEENEDVVLSFLKKRKDYKISNNYDILKTKQLKALFTEKGFFKTYPKAAHMDGFFSAVLERRTRPT